MTFDDFPSLLARAQAHAGDFLHDLPTRFVGARASRGGLLPRGWQKVDGLAVEA